LGEKEYMKTVFPPIVEPGLSQPLLLFNMAGITYVTLSGQKERGMLRKAMKGQTFATG
jgi:hypothetical protein